MKKNLRNSLLVIALTIGLSPICAPAQLKITEVESSETAGTFPTADWWELSNFGADSINLTGYRMDDNSDNYAVSVALTGITNIAPQESVVFFETTGTTLTTQDFRNWWGINLSPTVQVGTYSGSGVGLGSGGDAVNVFDTASNVVAGVTFGAATAGDTFGYDPNTQTFGGLSQNGVNGAFTSQNGDIGSPGAVPEPSIFAMLGLGAATLFGFYRNKRN